MRAQYIHQAELEAENKYRIELQNRKKRNDKLK